MFIDNPPSWNAKCNSYVYNFKGRVTEASIKNFQLVPFVDVGRVWDPGEQDPLHHLHMTAGLGARVDVRQLAVLRADVGVGIEEYTSGRQAILQVYVLAEHPF